MLGAPASAQSRCSAPASFVLTFGLYKAPIIEVSKDNISKVTVDSSAPKRAKSLRLIA